MKKYLPSIVIYHRNNEERKKDRFLLLSSEYYDMSDPNQSLEFFKRARELAEYWGYTIKCSEEEYLNYSQ
jgi:hypothetical protein